MYQHLAILLVMSHLFTQVTSGNNDGNTYDAVINTTTSVVDSDEKLLVYRVIGSCYVAPAIMGEGAHLSVRLYATHLLDGNQVGVLNRGLIADCPASDTWWLSTDAPALPSLADYLEAYAYNLTKTQGAPSRHRSVRAVDRRPSHNLRHRLHRLRTPTGDSTAGSSMHLSNDPYPSPLWSRLARDGHRFKHYKAFYDEVARSSDNRGAAGSSEASTERVQGEAYTVPRNGALNTYSLRVRNGSTDVTLNDTVNREGILNQSREYSKRHYLPLYKNSQGAKSLGDRESTQLYGLQTNLYNEQQNNSNTLHIPDSIIKDGQIFYRHDVNVDRKDPINIDNDHQQERLYDISEANYEIEPSQNQVDHLDQSLLFSQALGSAGHDGQFRAESEGRGFEGEATHSLVDGGPGGVSASSSAIRFNQLALAHVQVHPSSTSQLSSGVSQTDASGTPAPVSSADVEEMMKRHGLTGFAMASVTARKKDRRKPLSTLGHILPGYSNANEEIEESADNREIHNSNMVDSIVEQVYTPEMQDIIIDQDGLTGGSGDYHRESEFQQIHGGNLIEGGVENNGDSGTVGHATYTHGIHGYPPATDLDYSALYNNFEKYNYNPPLYFPEVDYVSVDGTEIPHQINGGQSDYYESGNQFPTDLTTGIQYPIIEGDVPPPQMNNSGNMMIVDNTLSSYFPNIAEKDTATRYDVTNEKPETAQHTTLRDLNSLDMTFTTTKPVLQHESDINWNYHSNGGQSMGGSIKVLNNELHAYDENNIYDQPSRQQPGRTSAEIWSDVDASLRAMNESDIGQPPTPAHLEQDVEPQRSVPTNDDLAQPAYNSFREYEKSQQREYIDEATLDQVHESHGRDTPTSSGYSNRNENKHSHQNEDIEGENGPDDDDYVDASYNAYETSSQSSSQSSQSVYTASHHYSYQHGSNERGIGSAAKTAVAEQSENMPAPFPSHAYRTPVSDTLYQQQPSPKPDVSEQPRKYQPVPRSDFVPMRLDEGSASQGAENMMVLRPGRAGSMQSLPSDDPGISEVKVVMAEAPSTTDLHHRMVKVISAGEKIPGARGYIIPPGFRGRLVLGNIAMSSTNSVQMSPAMAMNLNNQVHDQLFETQHNANMQGIHMSLSSSSSGSSSRSGVSLSSSSRAAGTGSMLVSSSSSSDQIGRENTYDQSSLQQPVYSYHQTFNNNPSNTFHRLNTAANPFNSNTMETHQQQRHLRDDQITNPRMRTNTQSSWGTSFRNGNSQGMGSEAAQQPRNSGQYTSESALMPAAEDCGYWSMKCFTVRGPSQFTKICRPTHIIVECCC